MNVRHHHLYSTTLQSQGWGQIPLLNVPATEGDNKGGQYRLYRVSFTPRNNLANGNGVLHFSGINGKAKFWLDGKLIGKKDTF